MPLDYDFITSNSFDNNKILQWNSTYSGYNSLSFEYRLPSDLSKKYYWSLLNTEHYNYCRNRKGFQFNLLDTKIPRLICAKFGNLGLEWININDLDYYTYEELIKTNNYSSVKHSMTTYYFQPLLLLVTKKADNIEKVIKVETLGNGLIID